MKRCTKCGEEKPLTDFHTSNGKPYSSCKVCHNARQAVVVTGG